MSRAGVLAAALFLVLGPVATDGAEPDPALSVLAVEADLGSPTLPEFVRGAAPAASVPAPEVKTGGDSGRPALQASAPTLGAASLRVAGASALVAVLLGLTLLMLRGLHGWRRGASRPGERPAGWRGWFSRWIAAPSSPADRLEVLARSHVGPKESVCIVRAGTERFLVGVTAHQIALLGRLDPVRETAEAGLDPAEPSTEPEPAAVDFALALAGAAASVSASTPPVAPATAAEASLRALLERSRERLSRLGAGLAPSGADRE